MTGAEIVYYPESEVVLRQATPRWWQQKQQGYRWDRRNEGSKKVKAGVCVVCMRSCKTVDFGRYETGGYRRYFDLDHCDACKWWGVTETVYDPDVRPFSAQISWGILKRFAVSAPDAPVRILREYLLKNYSAVGCISAGKAEELVLSVFRDVFPKAKVYYFRGGVYTADEGIDLVLFHDEANVFAIQVKRRTSRRSEPVEAVRSFVAALMLNGIRKGIYVSLASRFTKLAEKIPGNAHLKELGFELQLVDSEKFYALLRECGCRPPISPWPVFMNDYDSCSDEPYFKRLKEEYRTH